MTLSTFKHWTKLTIQSKYRYAHKIKQELERIKTFPRYSNVYTNLLGKNLIIVDGWSFYYSYQEIFERGIYAFKSTKTSPVILDGGSNIGLSVIYFKMLYPNSKIFAFEADPKLFQILKSNIANFSYNDVELIDKAIWNSDTILDFAVEGADGGRISHKIDEENADKIKVKTVRLRNYLDQNIDFLKLDIEGAETDVILDCSDCLYKVENLFIEYHSFLKEEQRLDDILHILKKANFRIQIQTQFCSPQPLLDRSTQLGMDLQLNIFAYRD